MSPEIETTPIQPSTQFRIRFGIGLTVLGFFIFVIGADPGLFNLDRSPVIGFVQISVFLAGLGLICVGGYISLASLWNSGERSILADIGLRLVATGYVIAVASGMADIFGFGTHPFPGVPYFGPWQELGVLIGEVVIGIGFLLLIPYQPAPKSNSHKTRPEIQVLIDNEPGLGDESTEQENRA
jgi:hypothetical protein